MTADALLSFYTFGSRFVKQFRTAFAIFCNMPSNRNFFFLFFVRYHQLVFNFLCGLYRILCQNRKKHGIWGRPQAT